MSDTFTALILDLNRPSPKGHLYSVEVVQKAIDEARLKLAAGECVGETNPDLTESSQVPEIDREMVTHVVERLWIDQGKLYGRFRFNGTTLAGQAVTGFQEGSLRFLPRGVGMLDETGRVLAYSLVAVDLLPVFKQTGENVCTGMGAGLTGPKPEPK